ncbi:Rieske 2Fe-2S domain-containing protein [Ilumatobacter sp.]|uniref:Rieske 2Fe-2S domain-containing protein n=1 Tax=Ilumatobacter sp. TaxID=1967498 RepID=UPI003B523400
MAVPLPQGRTTDPAAPTDPQDVLLGVLARAWHPVCATDDLAPGAVRAVRLLERDLVVARLADGSAVALADRCPHRSTKLSTGSVDGCALRCAYHGWAWDADGRCTDIPSLPDGPIPAKAVVDAHDVEERHGLVWVRLAGAGDEATGWGIPPSTASDETSMRTLVGEPYTWPVSALRRVENFMDLAHFAFVHDGSLGRRDAPVPPLPTIERVGTELRFTYEPPEFAADGAAMYGTSHYRVAMPCTVQIDFRLETGARRILWMTASPIDRTTCRTFWSMSRDDELHDDDPGARAEVDARHVEFQQQVLDEDAPVVGAQVPGEFPLDPATELSVSTDLVSNVYRRWVRELVREEAARRTGPAADAAAVAAVALDRRRVDPVPTRATAPAMSGGR